MLPDGIYFDLSFDDYLAEERISASSLSSLMEGPPAFWAASWMNPDKAERVETDPMKLGTAYHCARLEPEKFHEQYVRDFTDEGYDLKTDSDYKRALKDLGLPQAFKDDTGVVSRAWRLSAADPDAKIYHMDRAIWEGETQAGRIPLAPKAFDEIERDKGRVRDNPEIAALISDGVPEVSILWTHPDTGICCKCRPDYLGPDWITHLKTWDARSFGMTGNRSIRNAFQYNGYYRTGWFYHLALQSLAGLGQNKTDGSIEHNPTKEQSALLKSWASAEFDSFFLFLRRSGIPDIRAREVRYMNEAPGVDDQSIGSAKQPPRVTSIMAYKADMEVSACLKSFKECLEIYGSDPWYPRDMIGVIEDSDFSPYWLDSLEDPR